MAPCEFCERKATYVCKCDVCVEENEPQKYHTCDMHRSIVSQDHANNRNRQAIWRSMCNPMVLQVWKSPTMHVVAESAEEAMRIVLEEIGDPDEGPWEVCSPTEPLRIMTDADDRECGCREKRADAPERFNRLQAGMRKWMEKEKQYFTSKSYWSVTRRFLSNGHHIDCPVGSQVKTCEEWAKEHGKGILCSTEF